MIKKYHPFIKYLRNGLTVEYKKAASTIKQNNI